MTTKAAETPAQARCPYCHSDGSTRWDNQRKWGAKAIEESTGDMVGCLALNLSDCELLDTSWGHAYTVRYCPMCGRRLDD
jgi:hypothetical protein